MPRQQPLGPIAGDFTDSKGRLSRNAQVWLSILLRKVNFHNAYSDFYFETVSAGQQSGIWKNDTGYTLIPALLNLQCVQASTTGDTLFDIQTSPDLSTWTSLLTGGGVTLPKNSQSIAEISTFPKTASIPQGSYCWCVTKTGTATDAKQVQIQFALEYSLNQ